MKILYLLPTLKAAGAEVLAVLILCELKKKGLDVGICLYRSPSDSKGKQMLEHLRTLDVAVHCPADKGKRSLLQCVRSYRTAISAFKPDIVHVHLLVPLLLCALASIFRSRDYIVIETVHNVVFTGPFPSFLMYWLSRCRDATLYCSQAVEDAYPVKWRSKMEACIPNAVPIYGDKPSDLPERHKFRFCVIGAFRRGYPKGQDLVVSAVEQLSIEQRKNIEIVFIGNGPELTQVKEMVLEKGLASCFIFKGIVDDVVCEIKNSHCLLMPSRYEGMPMALLEAMMVGRPAILSDISAFGEFSSLAAVFQCSLLPAEIAACIWSFVSLSTDHLDSLCLSMYEHAVSEHSLESSVMKHIDMYNRLVHLDA